MISVIYVSNSVKMRPVKLTFSTIISQRLLSMSHTSPLHLGCIVQDEIAELNITQASLVRYIYRK
ncbi:MAG: hypothetical protein M2R45_02947 [Verrucomicrobia subdivision 3 bacterium]|nr:hypothetical protein [Limisphaerales bacterium]